MYMKLRVCSPSPQISTSGSLANFALITFRQIAAGAFAPAVVGPPRSVDVVETDDPAMTP